MTEIDPKSESESSFVLEYRLTEADVRRYATSGKVRACRQLCRDQGRGLLLVLGLGLVLLVLVCRSLGARSLGLMLAVSLAVLGALGWLRRARHCGEECRLARAVGVPLDIRLAVTAGGITKDASADESDPARTFLWAEVVEIDRADHLTVIRLRPAGAVLLLPDRAFSDNQTRDRCVSTLRRWRESGAGARP